ncbi:MAG: hypothetical protein IPL08_15505 [Saprospiraceae bacterium]|nr:hypothetical protein [Saprospiraceae bacterium]MBL0098832.1 hypothetical protein [Saprospiraceae bacterium]
MKIVALILSLLIFCQSLSVCGPTFYRHQVNSKGSECKIEDAGKSTPVKGCCSKKDNKQKDKKGCCGDNCQCITCAKVCLNTFLFTKITISEPNTFTKKVLFPVLVHSYDFHPSISYPPNL